MNSSTGSNSSQKLRFRILECSSEDSQFPASELLSSSSQSRGWQSQRFCPYPQYITFQFLTPVVLKQLQFMSHESKIPSRIEIFLATPDLTTTVQQVEPTFKRLGQIELDTNEHSNYQLRELKTVYIDRPCLYLKVLFHKGYKNRLNFFNQVGLIAMGAFGEQYGNFNYPLPVKNLQTISAPITQRNRTEHESELDEVIKIKISEMEEAKIRAVQNEEFDEAQRLKGELIKLNQLGNQVRRLEEKKLVAVENEDYESAKVFKKEIDRYREAITNVINGHRPRMTGMPSTLNQNPSDHLLPPRSSVGERYSNRTPPNFRPTLTPLDGDRSRSEDGYGGYEEAKKTSNYEEAYGNSAQNQRKKQALKQPPVNFDEQVIPTMARKNLGGLQGGVNEEPTQEQGNTAHVAEELSQATQKLAAPLMPVLGQDLCKKLFSKHWDLRESAIQIITAELPNSFSKVLNMSDPWALFVATMGAVSYTITDRINQVSTKSMILLKLLLSRKAPTAGQKDNFIVYIDMVLNGLLEKIGDNNIRIREQAEEVILTMTKSPVISCQFCLSIILKDNNTGKFKGPQSIRHTLGRIKILQKMISMFKIDNQEIPYVPVIDYCLEKLENPSTEVRSAITTVFGDIYLLVGDRIRSDLHEVRPAQMEMLQKEFDARNQKAGQSKEQPSQKSKGK